MRFILPIICLIIGQGLFSQVNYKRLAENEHFNWLADSSSKELTIYYQSGSWTEKRLETVRQRVLKHIDLVKSFAGIESYSRRIHLFIVESRAQMKLLTGQETNGSAFYRISAITGIASEKSNSVYSNHEIFHVIAMNEWGVPDTWLNEGMAVYSDNKWHGYDLYQLANYLVDNNRQVPLNTLVKDFRKVDDLISYPLAGSFVKYLDETYGRETILEFWKKKTRNFKKYTGRSLEELEADWLAKIKTVEYSGIRY